MSTGTLIAVGYTTKLVLGAEYTDNRSGVTGHVYGINFHSKGCVDAIIQWYKDGEQKLLFVPEDRLIESNQLEDAPDQEYTTHIVLDRKYRDVQTGLEGWAAVVQFFDHMATRVDMRRLSEKDGMQKIAYNSIDDFLLEEIAEAVPTPEPTGKKSPVMQEERYR